jgi:hypothetical protein
MILSCISTCIGLLMRIGLSKFKKARTTLNRNNASIV